MAPIRSSTKPMKLNKKQVEELLAQREEELQSQKDAFAQLEARLSAMEATNQQLTAAVSTANTAQNAPGAAASTAGTTNLVARPRGKNYSIYSEMGITKTEYKAIQRSIRTLTVRAELDWTQDFRRQDAEKLALVFKAARKEHPVLKNYRDNWATSAIVKQYFQNKRKHAYLSGYITKPGQASRSKNKENIPVIGNDTSDDNGDDENSE